MGDVTRTVRALLVDDHPVVRYGVRHILDAEPDIEVVGELESFEGISEILQRTQPDIMLLDLELGDVNGVEALRQLRPIASSLKVIIYTAHDEDEYIVQAAELGVDGYLLKGSRREEIVGAVRNVSQGGSVIESAVAAKLMKHMTRQSATETEPPVSFSKREKQVLELLAEGLMNRAIGAKLFISESTVKFHVRAILSKLNASNRTEAVSIAVKSGIISLPGAT